MGAITNTFTTNDAKGNREELSDIVQKVYPDDTVILSAIGSKKTKSRRPEWEDDTIRRPQENAQLEGDQYAFNQVSPPRRMGNPTQIFRESAAISRTQQQVDNAGNHEQLKEQMIMRMRAVLRDVEYAICMNQASSLGDPRKLGGLPTWLDTNVSRGSGGANGGYDATTGLTQAATDGTQRDLDKSLIDDVLTQCVENGASPNMLVLKPRDRQKLVEALRADKTVQNYRTIKGREVPVTDAVSVYYGPNGMVRVFSSTVLAQGPAGSEPDVRRNAFIIDPTRMKFRWIQKPKRSKVDLLADAVGGVIIGEGTLEVSSPRAHGIIADLNV